MGFDLHAPNGEYFRNNIWWWRPLWEFVYGQTSNVLNAEDYEGGQSNSGHFITKRKAHKLADELFELIDKGTVLKFEVDYRTFLEELPLVKCETCLGTGKREGEECNNCKGTGETKDFRTWYPFSEDNVKDFAVFCRNSDGFSIW